MSTNTNDLAKVLANAVLTTISDDDFKAEAARRGLTDERDDEWVVGEVFRRGLAADVLRDVADKMRLTY